MKNLYFIIIFIIGILNAIQAQNSGTFTDERDSTEYKWVKIGEQIWMAENLAYLPKVSPPSDGSNTEPYYYVYGYKGSSVREAKETDNYTTYGVLNYTTCGVLYNWPAALEACPDGWHLPTDEEWKQLEMYIGMSQSEADQAGNRGTDEGTKLKATSGWNNNSNGTDDYGFSALPGGYRYYGFSALPGGYRYDGGYFLTIGYTSYWWTATELGSNEARRRHLYYNGTDIYRYYSYKKAGFSVRCVRD